jgi:hypothetical protein
MTESERKLNSTNPLHVESSIESYPNEIDLEMARANELNVYWEPHFRLVSLLENLQKKYIGARYLLELIANPDRPIHATNLRNIFNQPETKHIIDIDEDEVEYGKKYLFFNSINPQWELPIKAADEKAITQVKQRLIKVIKLQAIAMQNNDLAKIEELIDEKDKLLDWLKKALNRFNRPRYLQNQAITDYQAVAKTIRLIIKVIGKDNPELVVFINEHYRAGMQFCWYRDSRTQ